MSDIKDIQLREVKELLDTVASTDDSDLNLDALAYNVLRNFNYEDYERVSDIFVSSDSQASFAFLGRDVEDYKSVMQDLRSYGHEIVLHGHRHVKFGDLSYDVAHDDLTQALNAFEESANITPAGFFPPMDEVNGETLQAAEELGFEWVFGELTNKSVQVPDTITLVSPSSPHDYQLLHRGLSPEQTFNELLERAESDSGILFHPHVLEYFDATPNLEEWVSKIEPRKISDQISSGGVGVVIDANRPLKII